MSVEKKSTGQEKNENSLRYNSSFFPLATQVEEQLWENPNALEEYIKNKQLESFHLKNPPELKKLRGETTQALVLTLNLSTDAKIIVLDTPEANAISLGRFPSLDENSGFQPARYHIGPGAILDMRIAWMQALQVPHIHDTLVNQHKGETGFVLMTREGQLIDPNVGAYLVLGLTIPTTVATVSHRKDPQMPTFGRVASLQPINCEAIFQSKPRLIAIFDNTASGMQQVAVLEEVLRQSEEKGNNLTDILIYSPLLTLYSAVIISKFAEERGLRILFVANGCLLGCNPPDRYYSPATDNPDRIPDPRLLKIVEAAHGNLFGRACARCNWTESFLSTSDPNSKAMVDSELELQMYGSSNKELLRRSAQLTPSKAIKLGVNPSRLFPYSSMLQLGHKL